MERSILYIVILVIAIGSGFWIKTLQNQNARLETAIKKERQVVIDSMRIVADDAIEKAAATVAKLPKPRPTPPATNEEKIEYLKNLSR